jgi:IS30 family transposase
MQSTPSKRYQQLQPEDRVTLASLTQQRYSVRAMAQVLGRSPSTISRELRRNAQPAGYASTLALAPSNAACAPALRASSIAMAFCLI